MTMTAESAAQMLHTAGKLNDIMVDLIERALVKGGLGSLVALVEAQRQKRTRTGIGEALVGETLMRLSDRLPTAMRDAQRGDRTQLDELLPRLAACVVEVQERSSLMAAPLPKGRQA